MLPTAIVNEIDALVRAGTLSNRKIAMRLGVSRGVVNAIASGKRQLHGGDSDAALLPLGATRPAVRCPYCGYRVYMPCLVCRTREHKRSQRLWALLAQVNRRCAESTHRRAG